MITTIARTLSGVIVEMRDDALAHITPAMLRAAAHHEPPVQIEAVVLDARDLAGVGRMLGVRPG